MLPKLSLLLSLSCVVAPCVLAAVPCPMQQPGGQQGAATPLQQAGQALQQGNPDQAIAILKPLTETQPQNARAWYLLGYAYHAKQDLEKAIPAHTRAASFPATAAGAGYNLACAYALSGDPDAAFRWLEKAKAAGFQGWVQMWSDPDLISLQGDARFLTYAPPRADSDRPFVEPTEVLFAWHGENANDQFGWVAVDAGDIDSDGVHDVLTSAPYLTLGPNQRAAGRVYLYSGRTGEELRRHTGTAGDLLGLSVSGVGDLDGDGHADYAATATRTNDPVRPGAEMVWSGKDGKVLRMWTCSIAGATMGFDSTSLPDCNGDGARDLLFTAAWTGAQGPKTGSVYLVSGKLD